MSGRLHQLQTRLRTASGALRAQIRQTLVEPLLTVLFPPRCGACDEPMAVRRDVGMCEACVEVLTPNISPKCPRCDAPGVTGRCSRCRSRPGSFVALRAPWVYGGGLADMIVQTKFRSREDLAAPLGHLLLLDEEARELAASADRLVPVPLGPARRRQRGYNQAVALTRVVAAATGTPMLHALTRTRDTRPQSDLPLAERASNLQGAFRARRPVPYGRIALVDDVVTSGETVGQAARALLDAGAREVVVLAVARAEAARAVGKAARKW